jgi:hypothetical protein
MVCGAEEKAIDIQYNDSDAMSRTCIEYPLQE